MSDAASSPFAPRVSVIMPTFKQAGFLRRAIDSLFTQSMTGLGAHRRRRWIAGRHPTPSWRRFSPTHGCGAIRLDTNQGLGRALNAGLDASRGTLDRLSAVGRRLVPGPPGEPGSIFSPASPNSPSPTPEFATITIGRLRDRSTANRCSSCKPCTVAPRPLAGAIRADDRRPGANALVTPARRGPRRGDRPGHLRVGGSPRSATQAPARTDRRHQPVSSSIATCASRCAFIRRGELHRRGRALCAVPRSP